MILEVKAVPKNPTAVDILAAGKKVENVSVVRVNTERGKLTVQAVIVYDPSMTVFRSKSTHESRGENE
jgi:hypothetical protein